MDAIGTPQQRSRRGEVPRGDRLAHPGAADALAVDLDEADPAHREPVFRPSRSNRATSPERPRPNRHSLPTQMRAIPAAGAAARSFLTNSSPVSIANP